MMHGHKDIKLLHLNYHQKMPLINYYTPWNTLL